MNEIRTSLTERLGIRWPIVQAPIGSGSTPELAAAVTNAGGLGMLAVTWRSQQEITDVLETAKHATDGPLGANIVLDPQATDDSTDDQVDTVLATGIDLLSCSFGDCRAYVDRVHDAGALIAQTVGSVAEAQTAVEAGVDIVVAQGWEAGGHVQSEVATMPLVPRVVDAVPETPVVAAGGIGDGRGIAAALSLGAAGVWLGTRFIPTRESGFHAGYTQAVLDGTASQTVYGKPFARGWPDQPHRVLRNDTVTRWEDAGRPPIGARPGDDDIVASQPDGRSVTRYSDEVPLEGSTGDVDELAHYAGQSVGLVEKRQSAAETVRQLGTETIEALEHPVGVGES